MTATCTLSALDSAQRDEEDFMLSTIPDQAWNLALSGAPTLDIVRAIRAHGRVDYGLEANVKIVEKMRRMLAGLCV